MKQEEHSRCQSAKPLLIYDGGCAFCCESVGRLERLTGDGVAYRASGDAKSAFPEIPASEFERAVQLVRPDGSRCSGAEAVLEVAAPHSKVVRFVIRAYRRHAVVRVLLERVYGFVASHRSWFSALAKFP